MQIFVQKSAIYERLNCAIPVWPIVVQSFVQILCQIMCKICNIDNIQIYCTVLHILFSFVNNIGTTWFADEPGESAVTCQSQATRNNLGIARAPPGRLRATPWAVPEGKEDNKSLENNAGSGSRARPALGINIGYGNEESSRCSQSLAPCISSSSRRHSL